MITMGGLCRRALRGSTPLTTHNLNHALRARPSSQRLIYFQKLSSISTHGRGEYFLLFMLRCRTAFEADTKSAHTIDMQAQQWSGNRTPRRSPLETTVTKVSHVGLKDIMNTTVVFMMSFSQSLKVGDKRDSQPSSNTYIHQWSGI